MGVGGVVLELWGVGGWVMWWGWVGFGVFGGGGYGMRGGYVWEWVVVGSGMVLMGVGG